MDSTRIEDEVPVAEAEDQHAEAASDTSIEDEDALEGPEEKVRPVLFNMPILRLVKFIVCASAFALFLNPPSELLKRSSEVHVSLVRWEPSQPVSEADSAIAVLASEAGDGVEAAAEAIAEKVSSIIAPNAALVRSERPAEPLRRSMRQEDVDIHRHMLWQGIKSAVGSTRLYVKQKPTPDDTGEEPSVGFGVADMEQEDEIHEVETEAIDLAWRDLNTLPHIIIAVILIAGFIVNLRSFVAGILQSLPGYLGKSRA